MLITKYFVLFIFYSFLGWIYESCFCTINEHSWQNRGFLYGPCVPIYGFGAIGAQILFIDIPISFIDQESNWMIFIICAAGSFILEYVTSYVLEKKFHARWWDYSKMPLNINGRVCLIFTACFGIAGVLIINYVIPPILHVASFIPNPLMELIALIFMMLLGMDMALTVSSLTSFAKEFERINDQINAQIAEKYIALETSVNDKRIAGIEMMEASKEALYVKKELTTEKINEIREQLTLEYLKKALENATESQRGQLRHITTFTHPVASTKSLMENGAKLLKDKKEQLKQKKIEG